MHKPWPLAIALSLALLGPTAHATDAAEVRQQAVAFNLPADSLANTLNAIARQTGQVIALDPALVQGKQAPAIRGNFSPLQALQRALDGSDLELRVTGSGNFSVQPASSGGSALELGATSINSGLLLGATSEGSGSYAARAVSIGKSTQTLREIPQSVSVMTRKLMDEKNLTSLEQVMAKTPGITFGQRNFGAHVFQSRGFVLDESSYLMDGVPGQAYTVTGWLPPDTAIYDRVEVLRGAAGLLVGAGNPGGAVNLVRKRPTATPQFSITARAGSWDNYRLDLDGSGSLNDAGTLRGRLVTAYEDKGSYLDEKKSRTPLLYGIVEADLGSDTTLTLSLRRQTGKINGYSIFGLPRYSDGTAPNISRSTALVQDWNSHETRMNEAFAEVEHRFNDTWSNKTSLTYSDGGFKQAIAYARGPLDPVTHAGSTFRGVQFRHLDVKSIGADTHFEGNFDAFGLTHQLVLGANWSRQNVTDKMADIFFSSADRVPVNIFDVDHHAFAKPARPAWTSVTDLVDEQSGIYANTRLRLSEPLSLVLGARVSWYNYDFKYKIGAGDYTTKESGQFTPFAGLIYDLDQNWSWYASYSDIFLPQSRYRDIGGSPLKPAIGASYETGVKGELFDKRLNLALALFYVKQEDVSQADDEAYAAGIRCTGNDAYGTCYNNGSIQRSKGFDVEASGELLPGLQVMGGYTFNMTRQNSGGPVSSETPKHLARLSTSYIVPGSLERLTVGGGVSAQSRYENETSTGRKYGASGRAIWDARVAWKLDPHWQVSLTGENLFDRKYYMSADGLDRVNLFGEPRSYVVTLRGDF
ncbi:TonB-dependent siderophore receptor [Pseudomonas sp. ABC1]|uniref:TonB-dependent siderophore receptor n=1 Tax=Pseudomonas sp. ABC1 TaxID=2748080 RepID=UPI0015C2D5C8|nr:TonB-dependent siderophore receptor [Pseudomonas sp. ABC1]QLF93504.1 TonB-dependent siderophore receptor [Pseudomonas sp. ABC1]